MAVQAQYPSNILLFNRNVQEEKNMLGNNDYSLQTQPSGGGFLDQSHAIFNNNNGVGINANMRKRSREVAEANPTTKANINNSFSFSIQNHNHQHQHQHHHQNQNQNHQLIDLSQLQNQQNVVSTGLRLSFGDQTQQQIQQQQQQQQIQEQHHPTLSSLLSEQLALQLKQQSDELNYFLHAQGEQLRRTVAEKRQRHYRALVAATEQAVARRMREKEVEVEKATRRNAELEAKAAQLGFEAQAWRAKAQAQEAQAASLQAQLHQAISVGVGPTCGAQQQEREGAELGCAGVGEVEDSESAYIDPVSERRSISPSCRVCQKRVVSVVLLPCRHLCVCRDCDDVVQACPVCLSLRTASVEVYLT